MRQLTREDIRVRHKGGDLWIAWIPDAPKSPNRKPKYRSVHGESEEQAMDDLETWEELQHALG